MPTIEDKTAKEKIKKALSEASICMTQIEAERDSIKEIIDDLSDEFDIPKKTVRKMIKVYHKQNFGEEVAETEEFQTLYEQVTGELTWKK
jgi:hypothetical protein